MNINKLKNTAMKACLLLIPFTLLLLQGCKDIKSKNITGDIPILILPQVKDTVGINPVHFKWAAMDGATKYRLQIATPSFSNMTDFVLDSVVSVTDFYFQLDSNQYELKLTAINSGYESQTLGPVLFWVGTSGSSNPTPSADLVLTTPVNNSFVKLDFNGMFKWNAVPAGASYEFELRKGGTSFSDGTVVDSKTLGQALDYTLTQSLDQNQYWWRVMAFDANAEFIAQKQSAFILDSLTPNIPTLVTPANNAMNVTITDSTEFTWNIVAQSSQFQSANYYVIKVASDASFSANSILYNETTTTLSKKIKLSNCVVGTDYFWIVIAKDQAGNVAVQTPSNKFTVN